MAKKTITLAVRKTAETSQTFEVTEDQLARLMNGDNPFYEEMEKKLEKDGEVRWDYAVLDADGEKYLVPWS